MEGSGLGNRKEPRQGKSAERYEGIAFSGRKHEVESMRSHVEVLDAE